MACNSFSGALSGLPSRGSDAPARGDDVVAARGLAGLRLPRTVASGVDVLLFRQTDSTNSVAARVLAKGGADGRAYDGFPDLVVVADSQTGGHGRLGRPWRERPHGSMMVSYVGVMPWSVVSDPSVNGWISLLSGLAALDAVDDVVGCCGALPTHDDCSMALKWPNDIFCDGLKMGGILVQIVPLDESLAGVVVGVGMNTSIAQSDLPIAGSTSLMVHRSPLPGDDDLRDMMVAALSRHLRSRMDGFVHDPRQVADQTHDEMLGRCWTLGRRVKARLTNGGAIVGTALDLESDAALRIRDDTGVIHVVSTGDVGVLAGDFAEGMVG